MAARKRPREDTRTSTSVNWQVYGQDPIEAILNIIEEARAKMTPAQRRVADRRFMEIVRREERRAIRRERARKEKNGNL